MTNTMRVVAARFCFVALMALALPTQRAHAQEPSAAQVAAARELIELKKASEMFDSVIPGILEQVRGTILSTNPALSKDLDPITAAVRNEFMPRRAELLNDIAKLYARRFTEKELRETIAFYKTPAGAKMVAEEPVVLDQMISAASTWARKISDDVMNRVRAEMNKKGHKL